MQNHDALLEIKICFAERRDTVQTLYCSNTHQWEYNILDYIYIYTHTHTHIYIYACMHVDACTHTMLKSWT